MFLPRKVILAVTFGSAFVFPAWAYDFGRPATPDQIKLWDIDVRPNGTGLPQGSGTVAHGKEVYRDNCEVCHGTNGEGGIKDRLVGGEGSLASTQQQASIAHQKHGGRQDSTGGLRTDDLAETVALETIGKHLLAAARPAIDQHHDGFAPLHVLHPGMAVAIHADD